MADTKKDIEGLGGNYDISNMYRKNLDLGFDQSLTQRPKDALNQQHIQQYNQQHIQQKMLNMSSNAYASQETQKQPDNRIGIQLEEVSNGTIITVGIGSPNRVIRICPKEETLSDQITAAIAEFKLK